VSDTTEGRTTTAARLRRASRSWLRIALRLSFVLVYVVGLMSEVGAFWRIEAGTTTLLAGAFTAFGLLASISFGLVRALPPAATHAAALGLAAGWRALHAAVLSLAALTIAHGFSEGWPGLRLLAGTVPTGILLRALFVALGIGAASSGLVALWRIEALVTDRSPRPPLA
jgi:hypothetical protein